MGSVSGAGEVRTGLCDVPSLRWVAVDVTGPLRVARERLDLSPVAAGTLGRCLAAATLVRASTSPEPSRAVVAISARGPLRRVMAESEASGGLRGMVSSPRIELPVSANDELGSKRALGDGVVTVIRHCTARTLQSHVALDSGRLGDSLARYFEQEGGTGTGVALGVLAEATGMSGAGGLLIKLSSEADPIQVAALETRLSGISGIGRILAADGLNGLLDAVLRDAPRRESGASVLQYRCPCTRSKIRSHLSSLPAGELETLESAAGQIEAECVFCGASYRFRPSELVA